MPAKLYIVKTRRDWWDLLLGLTAGILIWLGIFTGAFIVLSIVVSIVSGLRR